MGHLRSENNENSTRYDEDDAVFAAPPDTLLVNYMLSWSAVATMVSLFVAIVFLGLVTSRKARKHPFNRYLMYLMVPELFFSLLCGISCFTNAIHSYDGPPYYYWCQFQNWYFVWTIGSHMWMNAIIAHQMHHLCRASHHPNKQYTLPSTTKIRNQAFIVYIANGCLGVCLGFLKGGGGGGGGLVPSFYSPSPAAMTSGGGLSLSCLPLPGEGGDIMNTNSPLKSSYYIFWFVSPPLLVGIPLLYICYMYYDIIKHCVLLPSSEKEGRKVRNVVVYFGKIILVFVVIWVPYLLVLFVVPRVPPWVHLVGGVLTHLHGLFFGMICLGKPDVYDATQRFITCRWWYDHNRSSRNDTNSHTHPNNNNNNNADNNSQHKYENDDIEYEYEYKNDEDYNNDDNDDDNNNNNDVDDDDDSSSLNVNHLENYRTEIFLLPPLLQIRLDPKNKNKNKISIFKLPLFQRRHRHHNEKNISRVDASNNYPCHNYHHQHPTSFHRSSLTIDEYDWNIWAFPGPKRVSRSGKGIFHNTDTTLWPNNDGSYGSAITDDDGIMIGSSSSCSFDDVTTNSKNNNNRMAKKNDRPDARTKKLIEWNTKQLLVIIQKIVARRNAIATATIAAINTISKKRKKHNGSNHNLYARTPFRTNNTTNNDSDDQTKSCMPICDNNNNNNYSKHSNNIEANNNNNNSNSDNTKNSSMPLDEVAEIISLPKLHPKIAKREQDSTMIEIPSNVKEQLINYITCIAQMYNNDNPFHNFDHACHVMMSVIELMSRIVAPDNNNINDNNDAIIRDQSNTSRNNKSNDGTSSTMANDSSTFITATASEGFGTGTTAEIRIDPTYGITSDPLTQFGCAFSALIHDVDHAGVPNNCLIQEDVRLAHTYQSRSVAEQHAFDISWNLFMEDQYSDLRSCVCGTPIELARFRQIVLNSVMATDIADTEATESRNHRWEKAFHPAAATTTNTTTKLEIVAESDHSHTTTSTTSIFYDEGITTATNMTDTAIPNNATTTTSSTTDNDDDNQKNHDQSRCHQYHRNDEDLHINADVNRKATIIMEHLIQTADVSHTMQHWHVYRKWNTKLFMESYNAYIKGRTAAAYDTNDNKNDNSEENKNNNHTDHNPATTWYQREMDFFDATIIPLANKMKECGVFGVFSDEYLYYATLNRNEWKIHGEEIVQQMVQNVLIMEQKKKKAVAVATKKA